MVDYKNAERIRQLYIQLSSPERIRARDQLRDQFQQESALRRQQGFDCSLEPTTFWNSTVERFVDEIESGEAHPDVFKGARGHPKDPLYPVGMDGMPPTFFLYDMWCQIMVRAILVSRSAYDLDELMCLVDPQSAQLEGCLASFSGRLRGKVPDPDEYKQKPISQTLLTIQCGDVRWRSMLSLKTHYVYSSTASLSLSKGSLNGIMFVRSIDASKKTKSGRIVSFSCTPLIIGSGQLEIP